MDPQTQDKVTQDGFPTLDDVKQESAQQTLFDLEELTMSNLTSIEKLQAKKKELEQQIKDAVENDAVYHEKAKAAEEVLNAAESVKYQIMKQPSIMQMVHEVKSLRSEIKDRKFSVSDYALEILKHGVNQIEKDGQVYEIVTSAKLVKKQTSKQ